MRSRIAAASLRVDGRGAPDSPCGHAADYLRRICCRMVPRTVKRLIVNADDFGRSPGVNAGTLEAHVRGIVTSATVMVLETSAARGIREAAERAPRLSLGLHFALTGGGRPAGAARRQLPDAGAGGRFPPPPGGAAAESRPRRSAPSSRRRSTSSRSSRASRRRTWTRTTTSRSIPRSRRSSRRSRRSGRCRRARRATRPPGPARRRRADAGLISSTASTARTSASRRSRRILEAAARRDLRADVPSRDASTRSSRAVEHVRRRARVGDRDPVRPRDPRARARVLTASRSWVRRAVTAVRLGFRQRLPSAQKERRP